MSRSPFGNVNLAVDEPKGDPTRPTQRLNAPEPTYTSGRTPTYT